MQTTAALTLVTTAAEAFDRYQAFLAEDALIQGGWHQEQDGRHLACALGVLGGGVSSSQDCPAQVMPRWLAQMVPWMFDGMEPDEAKAWGSAFYAELARIDGKVPFSVIHDWHATVVGPLAIEVAEKRGRKPEVHKALAEMQFAALTGKKFSADEWRPVLKAAFYDAAAIAAAYADADANAYADADANAYAYAYAYAYANADADAYADANANAYAYAYAYAYANADADAYANADADAYADADANAYAYAYANADADAYADANAYAYAYARKASIARLANGLVDCLKRVEVA
ncbi:hypothetical protein ACFPIF_10360 [Brevundimonas faecalis]|uniref:hypothetical protein n=1 Tax=Brevundimonas faecalis TaxID=947378 RepID=UPI0036240A0D